MSRPKNTPTQPMTTNASPRNIRIPVAPAPRVQEHAPDYREAENAEDNAHHPKIQPHIPVEDMAEFVRDHASAIRPG